MIKKAFTLIELLITIAIIGILTGIASVSYASVQARGRDAQRINDLNLLKTTLSSYYSAQSTYTYVVCTTKTTLDSTSDPLTTALEPNFIKDIPLDPKNTGNYTYKYQSSNSNKDFTLFSTLENVNNKKGWNGGSSWVVDGYRVTND